ncbi:MAG: hypothetical protein RIS79_1302 [Verrucomicrobiota bacterium]|jgi:hypothetical protein
MGAQPAACGRVFGMGLAVYQRAFTAFAMIVRPTSIS